MKPKPKKPPEHPLLFLNPDEAAHQALAKAIEWAQGYGRMTAIADTLTLATSSCVSRQMVGRWLNPDPAKRVQTNLGTGLMLLHVVDTLANIPEPEAPWRPRESAQIYVALFKSKPAPKRTTTNPNNRKK